MTRSKPWYREGWLWFVLSPIIATVIGTMITLVIAGGPPDLVVDDYGQIPFTVEQDRGRDQRAALLGLVAEVHFIGTAASGERAVEVRLDGDEPPGLRLELVHPTLADRDERTLLARAGAVYRGVVSRPAGRLYLQLSDEGGSWRMTGEIAPDQDALQLAGRSPPGKPAP